MLSLDEQFGGLKTAFEAAMKNVKSGIRVCMPGIIQSFDSKTHTVTVQPAIREKLSQEGKTVDIDIPLLVDVPVVMPRAGGYILAFAPQKGDECLVMFSDLCIDSWWQSGGVQNQFTMRRHDLSDGFAILGVWSQKRKPSLPASGVRLQNENGSAGISIDGNHVNLFGYVTMNGSPLHSG